MKKIYLSVAVLALCMASCKQEVQVERDSDTVADSTVVDTVNTEAAVEQPRDSVAEMKAWEAYATPGDQHKMMADEVGTWTNDMTMWHGPDGPPEKATSTAVIKMILGGKYQETNYKGTMMGMPFEGRGTLAYDNAMKEYVSTWIDNMGTGMMVVRGKMADGATSMELKGDMVDPLTGKAMPVREVYTIVDADTRKMEMFDTKGGKEYKMLEIVMKRKK